MILLFLFFPFFCINKESEGNDNTIAIAGLSTDWCGVTDDSYIYIATANGYFHYIDILTGEVIWSVDTGGGIFDSTETDKSTFIPSVDGFLFTFINNYGYRRIPLPIRDLVFFSPFRTETGEIFTSGKSTSFYYVNDKGKIVYSYTFNSTIPTQGNAPSKSPNDGWVIFRIDYTLNIFESESKMVKFSEFDIIPRPNFHNNDGNEFPNEHKIKVTTTFNGGVTISVNGTVTAQLQLKGIPISVFGSCGKFGFEMNSDGQPMSRTSVAFMNINGNNVAVPSRPLKTPKHYDILTYGLPALPGSRGPRNDDRFSYGIFDIKNPFVAFGPLQSNVDPKRPANQMGEGFPFNFLELGSIHYNFNYWPISIILYSIFLTLLLFQIYTKKINAALASSIQIIVSDDNQSLGSFNNAKCSIFYADPDDNSVNETALKEVSELSHPYSLKIKAFVKRDEKIVIACQPLSEYHFSKMNPTTFIKRMMEVLSAMFKRGLVHGSINSSAIFADNEGEPILGGFHLSCHFSKNITERANDVKMIGMIVREHLKESDYSDLCSDPLLYDLLTEMCNSTNSYTIKNNIKKSNKPSQNQSTSNLEENEILNGDEYDYDEEAEETPTPEEVLKHPFFFSGAQKLDLITHASNFLHSKDSRSGRYINTFNAHSSEIVGDNWMHFLDRHLLQDAITHTDYKGESATELIRFIRNKWLHSPVMPNGKKCISSLQNADEYFNYFHKRFPNLFLYTYYFIDRYDKKGSGRI